MLICHTYIFFGEVSVHSNFWLLIVSIYQPTFLSNTIKVSGKKSMKQIPRHWILYSEGSWCLEDKKQLQSLSQVNFLEKVSIVLWIVVVGRIKEMKLRIWRIKGNSLQYREHWRGERYRRCQKSEESVPWEFSRMLMSTHMWWNYHQWGRGVFENITEQF